MCLRSSVISLTPPLSQSSARPHSPCWSRLTDMDHSWDAQYIESFVPLGGAGFDLTTCNKASTDMSPWSVVLAGPKETEESDAELLIVFIIGPRS